MDMEKRLKNLENLVNYLIKQINNLRFYTNADTEGNRVSLSNTDGNVEKNTADIDYIMIMEDL